jgi:tripartite-type tricarboxylate transporter receptor subunit TctC
LPKGASKDIVEQIHRQVTQIISLPDVKGRLAALGYSTINGSSEEFAAHLKAELTSWSAIAREQNIRID